MGEPSDSPRSPTRRVALLSLIALVLVTATLFVTHLSQRGTPSPGSAPLARQQQSALQGTPSEPLSLLSSSTPRQAPATPRAARPAGEPIVRGRVLDEAGVPVPSAAIEVGTLLPDTQLGSVPGFPRGNAWRPASRAARRARTSSYPWEPTSVRPRAPTA